MPHSPFMLRNLRHVLVALLLSSTLSSPSLAFLHPRNGNNPRTLLLLRNAQTVTRRTASTTYSTLQLAAAKMNNPTTRQGDDDDGDLRFITNKMCPFAQKAWLALEACSNRRYKLEEISLYGAGGKPDWFWELNPAGTVPVLVLQRPKEQKVWPDSDLILQAIVDGDLGSDGGYNDNTVNNQIQEWRQAINQMLPIGKKAVLGGGRGRSMQQLTKLLQDSMESRLDVESQFLAGESLTIADCHAFPFLWRLDQEFGLADGLECPNLAEWVERCSNIPQFRKTIQSSWWWWW